MSTTDIISIVCFFLGSLLCLVVGFVYGVKVGIKSEVKRDEDKQFRAYMRRACEFLRASSKNHMYYDENGDGDMKASYNTDSLVKQFVEYMNYDNNWYKAHDFQEGD